MSEEWMTALEVAKKFGVDDSTVRRWFRCGLIGGIQLPHKARGGLIRISRAAVEQLENPSNDPNIDNPK